jgi:hypothetical protein
MSISITSTTPPPGNSVSSIVRNAAAPLVNGEQARTEQQASAVVTLSAQGQKLSQSHAPVQANQTQNNQAQTPNRPDTAATENTESRAKEAAQAPGVQLLETESKGSRVNTLA